MASPKMSPIPRSSIAQRILDGETLIVYDGQLLKIPQSWVDAHPGGSLALLHFVGRDASDEIQAYHSEHALKLIKRYSVGAVETDEHGSWEALVPPIMTGWVRKPASNGTKEWYNESSTFAPLEGTTDILLVKRDDLGVEKGPTLSNLTPSPTSLSLKAQADHSAAYKLLHKRIVDAGLYKTPYLTGYGPEVLRYTMLAGLSAYAYYRNWLMTSAALLGFTWHQLVFTVHDLGHMGVTHDWTFDRLIAILIADWIGGLSVGWWVHNHNVHHLVTNHPSHDPDIQHIPFFAISPSFFFNLWSSYYKRIMPFDAFSQFLISLQHRIFYVVLALARFNLYRNSYVFLVQSAFDKKRARGGRWTWWLEVAGIAFFWCWFGSVLYGCGSWKKAFMYLLVSHIAASPVHVQIVLSHFSMSTADLGPVESFPHRQLRTTTDVICPPSLAFVHGGLHLQVTHHLFPRLPRHNLRKASMLVKEFAQEQGLVYAEFGFAEGNSEVVGVLRGVAEQVGIVGRVAGAEVKEVIERWESQWEQVSDKKTG
ncbi:hypothetical protein PC9H_003580 [Pleurotus ostreatus]|uniref:Delta 8-(E)-sphingolipid desaturase n=3 Tax=Pleurotus TaxID=5320 RepID=A0A067NV47_PLEO1|nr:uncharacterized protein PC9H_003580 [Pleurotus ostreatus]KAF7436747.1 hypothetical protein PC9H_003580 [Pleurotus ostreatus]KDQ30860.1 hypothetical protein PLEOSDRAFT_1062843 [Pleurotus ostreatus PC15]